MMNVKEILSSFLSQFYENKTVPKLILTNIEVKDYKLLEKAFSEKEKKEIIIKRAKTINEINISKLAERNAKQALTQKIYQAESNNNLIDSLVKKFNLNNNVNLIEVYDNSHIQGSDSIGALICFSNEGFVKKDIENLTLKMKKLKKMTMV